MNRPARIFAVTAGLALAGAVFGALAGSVGLLISILLEGERLGGGNFFFAALRIPAVIGALLGGVLAPALGWFLLRRVPLGRAVGGAALGTTIGGIVGWRAPIGIDQVYSAMLFAFVGCIVAAIVLRVRAQRLSTVETAPSE